MFVLKRVSVFELFYHHKTSLNHVKVFAKQTNNRITLHSRCLSSTESDIDLHFKPTFTESEQTKILSIVNQADADVLSKFDVSRGRIKNLETWRLKKGPFRSLSEILEVEGLGEKVLERLCKSIILNNTTEGFKPKTTSASNRKQFVTPTLDKDELESMKTAIGIHTSSTGVSWAKIALANNQVQAWSFQDFSFLPKKMLPTETYALAVQILTHLPPADAYVMEAAPGVSPQSPQQSKTIPTYIHQLELTSMLLALINSSPAHGGRLITDKDIAPDKLNKVYFMRAYLSARLFKTLVGNERVSSGAIMNKLLDQASDGVIPCTPINTSAEIRGQFFSQSSVHQDLMGQGLMLAASFLDLCVYKNENSLQIINRGRRN